MEQSVTHLCLFEAESINISFHFYPVFKWGKSVWRGAPLYRKLEVGSPTLAATLRIF